VKLQQCLYLKTVENTSKLKGAGLVPTSTRARH